MATIFDYFETGGNNYDTIYGAYWYAQDFTPSEDYYITAVRLFLYRSGSPGNITVSLRATNGSDTPTGEDLISVTQSGNEITTNSASQWVVFAFNSACKVVTGTTYSIVVRATSGNSSNWIRWTADASFPIGYADNDCVSSNSGSTWTINGRACYFETWGYSTSIVEKVYSKRLVAIAGSELWYETSAGTMAELSDANGGITSYLPVSAQEAYQKLFVTNVDNLKVADFVNSKLSTADIGSNLPNVGNTLTGGTSGATLIVDYINASSGATLVYGVNNTIATFISGETVTGTNNDGDTVSFALDADEDTGPHWYDWTVYAADSTNYGVLPSRATLITLYRGRIVTNDSDRPHAWHMSKVGEPFKFLYDYENDGELSALSYSNAVVGQIGDIITALIAYQDDMLVFGCANSVWVLVGDAMSDGQLIQLTKDTGIWGAQAWCFDDKNNLYFFGNDGLYRCAISTTITYPVNISKSKLPDLVKDLDLDKSLHRIVLSFDPIEQGIIISKTTLSDGTNSNYFFSLITEGFFAESYPTSCGIFSSYFYPALDETYKKFLVGGTDGYIREFDPATKNDTTTASTNAINSYVVMVEPLGNDESVNGLLNKLVAITSGGTSSGTFSDTDSVTYGLYKGDNAETVLEDIIDGATAFKTGSWTTTGKQNSIRTRIKGCWVGLKLSDSTASKTWSIEKIYCNIEPRGKV